MASFKRWLDYLDCLLVVWAGEESRLSRHCLWIWCKQSAMCMLATLAGGVQCCQLALLLVRQITVTWQCWSGNFDPWGTEPVKRVERLHDPAFEKVSVVLAWWDLASGRGSAESRDAWGGLHEAHVVVGFRSLLECPHSVWRSQGFPLAF